MKAVYFIVGTLFIATLQSAMVYAQVHERIVSAGGGVTEIICALGHESKLVGVDTSSLYPPSVKSLHKVGYQRTLSAEGVMSLRPDVLVGSADLGPERVVAQLKNAGIPVSMVADVMDLPSAVKRIRDVGKAINDEANANAMADKMEAESLAASAKAKQWQAQKPLKMAVFLGMGSRTPMVAGTGTGGHAMIELLGGENAFASVKGYKPLTAESMLIAKPDVFVVLKEAIDNLGSVEAFLALMPATNSVPAIANKRVVVMPVDELFGFSPRLPQVIDKLSQALQQQGIVYTTQP